MDAEHGTMNGKAFLFNSSFSIHGSSFPIVRIVHRLTALTLSLRMILRLQSLGFESLKARMSMVDGHPYKVEVGGSNPSVPTKEGLENAES